MADHAEIQELLGAYALDAVDPDEATLVENHLVTCPRCAAEVADHRNVAAMLAHSGDDAPDGIWNRIQARLEEAPPELRLAVAPPSAAAFGASTPVETERPVEDIDELAARRSRPGGRRADDHDGRRRWAFVGGVAAAVALVVALAVAALPGGDDGSARSVDLAGAARPVLADPEARRANLIGDDGTVANAAVTDEGTGFFVGSALPELTDVETYQLWAVHADGRVISVGVLGPAPEIVPFHLDGDVTQLVVTREVAGGVVSSTNPAVVAGTLD